MKDLEKMFDEALEIVKENIGDYEIRKIVRPITINYRAKKRWGLCETSPDRARIEISSRILRDEIPDDATMNVIIHEILHSVKGCKGHKGLWRSLANRITRNTKYKISKGDSAESFGLQEEQMQLMRKYACSCERCGAVIYKSRETQFIKHPEWYTHRKCGGHFKRTQLV